MKVMAQIFLCYARLDQRKVEELYNRLSDSGFKPWMDEKDILPGEKWEFAIQKAIRRSDFFVACLSANSVNRRGVIQKEIREALDIWKENLDSDIYLIPVRLEDCKVPESLRCFQWVNLFEEDGWERLVKAVQVGMERRGQVIAPLDKEPVFESELRKEWSEIRAMLEMIEQLAPECKEHVNALREAKAKLEACVVEDNECRFFYETAQWRKATEAIARFVSSRYPDPSVAELLGKIGVRLASAFYCAGYRFYARDCWKEAQVLFEQAVELDPMHVEAVQMKETVAKILAKRGENLAAHFAEAEEAAHRGCYEDAVRIIEYIRSIDRCHRQSELDRLLAVARLRRGGAS